MTDAAHRNGLARLERFTRLEVFAWLAAWFAVRGLLVLSFADVFIYGEEMEKACAAKALLGDLGVPHHQLAYHYYEGGGFVVSHLDALAFLVLGQSVLAIKVVALGLGAAVLAAGWCFCQRAGGRGAARAFALLFVLAPESVQKNSLLALGIHFHALIFVACILSTTARLAFERDLRARSWFAWGLSAGFGLYFSYQCALTLVLSIAVLVVSLKRGIWTRTALGGAAGFVLGLAPFLWMTAHVGSRVLDIHGAELLGGKEPKLEMLRQFVVSILGQRDVLDILALAALAFAPLISLAALSRRVALSLRSAAWLVLAHIALFVAAYIGSGFTVGRVYHYFLLHRLTPVWFLAVLATALGAAAARTSPRRWLRGCSLLCIVVPAAIGAWDTLRIVRGSAPHDFGQHVHRLAHTNGYEYSGYLRFLVPRLEGTRAEKLRVMLRFEDEHPALLHAAIAVVLYGDSQLSIEEVEAELAAAGIADQRGFLVNLGPLIMAQRSGNVASRFRAIAARRGPDRGPLLESIGRHVPASFITEDWLLGQIDKWMASNLSDEYFRGVGYRMFFARGDFEIEHYYESHRGPWMVDRERLHEVLDKYPERIARPLREGFETACAENEIRSP